MLVVDSNELGVVGFSGLMVIVEFELLEVVQVWVNDDLYIVVGVYCQVLVKLYKKVF